MGLESILIENREMIINECTRRIREKCGQRYGRRTVEELTGTTSEIADANFLALVHHDFSGIDRFIERIAAFRLYHDFALSEVQQAFELHRTIIIGLLAEALRGSELTVALHSLNDCLSYTINRFSDYYLGLREEKIRQYAETLEQEVAKRTRDLSESETKYRMLVEEINDGYFVNKHGRIVFVNKAFCEMHGCTPEEMKGHSYLDFVAPDSLQKVMNYQQRRLVGKNIPDIYVYHRLHKDGTALPTENRVKVMAYRGGYIMACVCRDITERVKMERRISESERLAHIGQLTTSLAHEIRNPLSSIKMSIQMALKSADIGGNGRRIMEISATEISRLEHILTEMLDFARPVTLKLEPGSIIEVINSCLRLLNVKIRDKKLRVEKKLLRGIQPVLMDREKMEQAIINVLLNAIEVLPIEGKISIAARYRGYPEQAIALYFTDNGPGASEEDLPYIFDPFFSRKTKGTGLGLFNVKRLVEAHGGTVAAKRINNGFSMRLTLPIKERNG